MTSMSGGIALAHSVGIPMPRLTKSPSFISATARRMIPSRLQAMRKPAPSAVPDRPALDPLLPGSDDQPVDENSGGVDALRAELSRLDELLHLRDRDLARG